MATNAAGRKFKIRGEDRRKQDLPVASDRRAGPRRTTQARSDRTGEEALRRALRKFEELLARIESDLVAVAGARDPDEVTQIPTRNETLAGAVRALGEAQSGLLDFVRLARGAARLTAELRSWTLEVAARAGEVEERLAAHMAERLHIDRPARAPRARRFTEKLERLLG